MPLAFAGGPDAGWMPVDAHPPARLSALRRGASVEVVADVVGGHAVQHGFDKGAGAIVRKVSVRYAAHDHRTVFGDAAALLHSLLLCPVL